MKVLIADDDPISRRLLQVTLLKLGHEVVAVADGRAALAALEEHDAPRLAILDWMMPHADGLDVCRAVRRRNGPYTYVILLTARQRQEDMVAGLDAEADDFLTKPFVPVELGARLRSGERVLHLQERLLRTQDALRYEASHDQLTGLLSRRMILEHLDLELGQSRSAGRPLAVVLADIDHFKRINDTYGHTAGDAVLRAAGMRLSLVLREGERLGRYGGEEFLLVLPGCDRSAGVAVAERLRTAMAETPVPAGPTEVVVTLSLGTASTVETAPAALIQTADEALYRAKALGRNRCVA